MHVSCTIAPWKSNNGTWKSPSESLQNHQTKPAFLQAVESNRGISSNHKKRDHLIGLRAGVTATPTHRNQKQKHILNQWWVGD